MCSPKFHGFSNLRFMIMLRVSGLGSSEQVPAVDKCFSFPIFISPFVIICFLDHSHFDWGKLKSQSNLLSISLISKDVKQLSQMKV